MPNNKLERLTLTIENGCSNKVFSLSLPHVYKVLLASFNLASLLSLSSPEKQREMMTLHPAIISELCVLLEGFPPQHLTSVLSQSLLST